MDNLTYNYYSILCYIFQCSLRKMSKSCTTCIFFVRLSKICSQFLYTFTKAKSINLLKTKLFSNKLITSYDHRHYNILEFILHIVQIPALAIKVGRKISAFPLPVFVFPYFIGNAPTIVHSCCFLLLCMFLCRFLRIGRYLTHSCPLC